MLAGPFQLSSALVEEAEHPGDQENQKNGPDADACSTARTPASVAIISAAASQHENQNDDEDEKHIIPSERARLATGTLELLALLDHLIAGLAARFFSFRRDHLAGLNHFVDGLLQVSRRLVDSLLYVLLVDAHVVLLGFFGSLENTGHVMRNSIVRYFQDWLRD